MKLSLNTQAAAYGLPVVATKNGGPVDILKVIILLLIFYEELYNWEELTIVPLFFIKFTGVLSSTLFGI